MGIVVILDQQESRHGPDRVEYAVGRLRPEIDRWLLRSLVRTAGDEMQAVVGEPPALLAIIEFCLRSREWWLGIGLGEIELLGETARDSRGPAFAAAREAVERAKRRRRWPVAVAGEPARRVERMQGMCDVLAFIAARRTVRRWEIIDAMRNAGSGSKVAAVLGITPQAANEQLRNSGVHEQEVLEREIGDLAAEALREERHA